MSKWDILKDIYLNNENIYQVDFIIADFSQKQ